MRAALVVALLAAGCAAAERGTVATFAPVLIPAWPTTCLPGTRLDFDVTGVPDDAELRFSIRLRGELQQEIGRTSIDWLLPAERDLLSPTRIAATLEPKRLSALWGDDAAAGTLALQATVLVEEVAGWQAIRSAPVDVSCALVRELKPELTEYARGPFGVNAPVTLTGSGFLIAPSEGRSRVLLDGCFAPTGSATGKDDPCGAHDRALEGVELDALPAAPARDVVTFIWPPSLSGLGGGTFFGTVQVRNDLAAGVQKKSPRYQVEMALRKPRVKQLVQTGASLGQYVDVEGDGFVGGALSEVTLLHLSGEFIAYLPDGSDGPSQPVELDLVPRVVDGQHARYVLDEADALGRRIDLRTTTGIFIGALSVTTQREGEIEIGEGAAIEFELLPIKQVVYVRFADSYRQSLKLFGLEAADAAIRARVLAVAARDYQGVNVEFRTTRPTDFELYSEVDVGGPDPNGVGFFGFDNTPGKDSGNRRLYDRIGGLDATTQSDGTPGYGGIFTEQFLGFSQRPGPAVPLGAAEPLFDRTFDPVRPDSGRPVHPTELAYADLSVGSGDCPGDDRPTQVRCAVLALGNLIGSTLTHELGHSLGLADPDGIAFHDLGDRPARLMDGGDARPLSERAELGGDPPALFCDTELDYLQRILPLPASRSKEIAAARALVRPPCD